MSATSQNSAEFERQVTIEIVKKWPSFAFSLLNERYKDEVIEAALGGQYLKGQFLETARPFRLAAIGSALSLGAPLAAMFDDCRDNVRDYLKGERETHPLTLEGWKADCAEVERILEELKASQAEEGRARTELTSTLEAEAERGDAMLRDAGLTPD